MSIDVPVLNANKEPEGQQFYVMECLFEYDRYGCERKDMTDLEWLTQEVDE